MAARTPSTVRTKPVLGLARLVVVKKSRTDTVSIKKPSLKFRF